jgi:hypothetical protein
LRRWRQIANRHVLDHAAAQRAHLGHRGLLSQGLGFDNRNPLRQDDFP